MAVSCFEGVKGVIGAASALGGFFGVLGCTGGGEAAFPAMGFWKGAILMGWIGRGAWMFGFLF